MVTRICDFLTNKIRAEMPEIDDERAEIIHYGLENIVGELPKTFIIFGIAWFLNIIDLTLITFVSIMMYRAFAGGFHAKTHIGCILFTSLLYLGPPLISKYIVFEQEWIKYIIIVAVWIFSMLMISWYAPADTENVPILRKSERKQKKILSYITMTATLLIASTISDNIISNIIWLSVLIQTLYITRLMYKITNNAYGYETFQQK